MKIIFALLLLIAVPATAHNLMKASNEGGGDIVLTDTWVDGCTKEQRVIFLTSKEGYMLYGCWELSGEYVFVRWQDNDVMVYSLKDFTAIPKELQ
jgi:hypothetical protein